MTNAQFKAMPDAEKALFFADLSQEEVSQLSQLQATEYEAWRSGSAGSTPASDQKSKAAEFFTDHPDYQNPGVYVTSDLVVFHGNVKGENSLLNYIASKKPEVITYSTFAKEA